MGSDDMADGAASNRAIAYVRVSTSKQADDGNSISSQVNRIRAYAKMRGLKLLSRDVVFTDFFCTNDAINSALTAIGFYEAIPLEELDIPRLFSPLQTDFRKTLHSAISFSADYTSENAHNVSDFYFTKGDTNQDMPNR